MIPMDSNYLDNYEDNDYDLIVFDEFKAQKRITWMNKFVQGDHVNVHRRYNDTIKIVNLPVIVLSNYSIEQAYSKVHMYNPKRLDSLKNRFNCINVKKFIKIFN